MDNKRWFMTDNRGCTGGGPDLHYRNSENIRIDDKIYTYLMMFNPSCKNSIKRLKRSNDDKDPTEEAKEWIIKFNEINLCDSNKNTLLHHAVKDGNLEMSIFLIDNGADIDVKNNSGDSALHNACCRGYKKIAKYLISKGALINQIGYECTPLQLTMHHCQYELIKNLINYGADPTIRSKKNYKASECCDDSEICNFLKFHEQIWYERYCDILCEIMKDRYNISFFVTKQIMYHFTYKDYLYVR